nr:MAG TPA: hypothetical protein [Caudoviricetes sp.]
MLLITKAGSLAIQYQAKPDGTRRLKHSYGLVYNQLVNCVWKSS